MVLLWSEVARVRDSGDLFSKIVFSDQKLGPLRTMYITSSSDAIFEEMIINMRGVGTLLRHKIAFYNVGSIIFVISIAFYIIGY
jgi:hypothetical protein